MKTYKCNICNIDFETPQAKANHTRWNHKDNSKYIEESKQRGKKVAEKVHGKLIEETVKCSTCNSNLEITYREGKKKDKYFCSRSCANSRGKRSEETKKKIAKSLSKDPLKKKCKHCNKEYYTKKDSQKFCSISCASKSKNRNDKNSYKRYRQLASFDFNLSEYPDKFDFSLVEKYGWYSAANRGNNLNGVSRDHMFSVMEGYEKGIDPLILAHPANCKLMRHNDNVSKNKRSSITYEELLDRIKNW